MSAATVKLGYLPFFVISLCFIMSGSIFIIFAQPAFRNRMATAHVRFNEFIDPEPVPLDTDCTSVITSSVPVVVQHTRLDAR